MTTDGKQPSLFDEDIPPWELDAQQECPAARVVFAEPPFGPFHYRIPPALEKTVTAGLRVSVPLGRGNRRVTGYCTAVEIVNRPKESLKEVFSALDERPLCDSHILKLIEWMSQYYLTPAGQIFEAVVPAGVRSSAGTRMRVLLRPSPKAGNETAVEDLPPKQRQVLQQLILADTPLTTDQLRKLANASTGPIQALRRSGWIIGEEQRVWDKTLTAAARTGGALPPALSADQRQCLQVITDALDSSKHETILLHGVTGSGKTEIYMQAIETTVSFGRQAIVLVPEISLTPQTRNRFQRRFGDVAVLHSHMSGPERHFQWQRIVAGDVNVVIGPRSAIFAPLPQLGLIILDEEHESSFKQETIPRYHARDVALQRAFFEKIPLVLGSATPSLESWHRSEVGHYKLASLPRRIHNRPMPRVQTIDLRDRRFTEAGSAISRPLDAAIQDTLAENGQTILLLNRRGFATTIQCTACGFVATCPDCDMPLTHHLDGARAMCHYCDYAILTPPHCPQCQEAINFRGLGTQRLEDEVNNRYPNAQIARMDSDTMRKPGSHERTLSAFRKGEIDVLLGTQMIAKGLDFPNVLLVGVINADSALHFPDFRASERTFQMVTQVAGRTGRGDKPGRVLVQTYSMDHPAITAAKEHDFLGFARDELKHREAYGYPPFGSQARIIIRGPDLEMTEAFADNVGNIIKAVARQESEHFRMLGPAPPPIGRLRGKYRFHLLMSDRQPQPLNRILRRAIADIKPADDIQYVIDIDPNDML